MPRKVQRHVEPNECWIDNRDTQMTEINFTHGNSHLIVRVNPWELLANLLENAPVLQQYKRGGWETTLDELAAEVEKEFDAVVDHRANQS